MPSIHLPVMLREVIDNLCIKPDENYIDCTLGAGGYTEAIAEKIGKEGKVVAFDLDPKAIAAFKKKNKNKNIILINDNFKNLSKNIGQIFTDKISLRSRKRISTKITVKNVEPKETENGFGQYAGIVFDLGLSSDQLQDGERGFSFNRPDSPLVMNFNAEESSDDSRDAITIVNKYSEYDLKKIIKEYGEERFAGRIARNIVIARKIEFIDKVGQLVAIVKRSVPGAYIRGHLHYATRTFQALRIATNKELQNITEALPQAMELLKPGGRIVVVSFHSLEDRIIKNFFRQLAKSCICPPEELRCVCGHKPEIKIITKKPLVPGREEILTNPRARSAKLRAAEKLI